MKHPRRWLTLFIILIFVLAGVDGVVGYQHFHPTPTTTPTPTTQRKAVAPIKKHVKMTVPLVNQMDAPTLYNGCEVTSLSMLLQYYNVDVTKNQLADKIKTVPLTYDDGEHGNPNVGFVGSVSGDTPGLGVYHGPITKLARKYHDHVRDISGSKFSAVIQALSTGHPVWTITTATFAKVDDFQSWDTPQGKMKITYSQHSVVITGYNKAKRVVYINNPYGEQNEAVDWDDFEAAYEQMGQQAVFINTTK